MLSAELCAEVYVTVAEVVTVVVVVTSGADVSTSEVAAVVIFAVSTLELSLLVGIFIASLVFDRLTVIDLLDTLYVAAQIKTVPIIIAP